MVPKNSQSQLFLHPDPRLPALESQRTLKDEDLARKGALFFSFFGIFKGKKEVYKSFSENSRFFC
jgi:hypothetical protein